MGDIPPSFIPRDIVGVPNRIKALGHIEVAASVLSSTQTAIYFVPDVGNKVVETAASPDADVAS